jgi:Plasmid pRiA4b ORF-3-like protein
LKPPIWRRIQVRDCTLDKLHERIQTAMGWNTSHLHHFRINDKLYGDPWLMRDNFVEFGYADSTVATLSKILPKSGERFRFEYEYDFGDSWWHDVLFEGCLRADPGQRYPLCLEGERACPPDDVGGTPGYQEFLEVIAGPDDEQLEAMADPDDEELEAFDDLDDERREEYLAWIGGSFDPESFDPEKATKRMRRGLPNWRKLM